MPSRQCTGLNLPADDELGLELDSIAEARDEATRGLASNKRRASAPGGMDFSQVNQLNKLRSMW